MSEQMAEVNRMKSCSRCGERKPLADYHAHAKCSDGHAGVCKRCCNAARKSNYWGNRERELEYHRRYALVPSRIESQKRYSQTEGRKLSHRSYVREYAKLNPLKHIARRLINDAISNGLLVRGSCEICGELLTHGHHDDYSKPMSVRWLCKKHHAEWHRNNTPMCPDQSQEIAS